MQQNAATLLLSVSPSSSELASAGCSCATKLPLSFPSGSGHPVLPRFLQQNLPRPSPPARLDSCQFSPLSAIDPTTRVFPSELFLRRNHHRLESCFCPNDLDHLTAEQEVHALLAAQTRCAAPARSDRELPTLHTQLTLKHFLLFDPADHSPRRRRHGTGIPAHNPVFLAGRTSHLQTSPTSHLDRHSRTQLTPPNPPPHRPGTRRSP
jgi:hypothetical protein